MAVKLVNRICLAAGEFSKPLAQLIVAGKSGAAVGLATGAVLVGMVSISLAVGLPILYHPSS